MQVNRKGIDFTIIYFIQVSFHFIGELCNDFEVAQQNFEKQKEKQRSGCGSCYTKLLTEHGNPLENKKL